MSSPARRRFTARQTEFESIRTFIEGRCATVSEAERQRAVLLVEELFANSVSHGYGGDSDRPVWLTVDIAEDGCRLVYEDCAPHHDPFARGGQNLANLGLEQRRIGGLGIVLLFELSSSRRYERRAERNIVELRVKQHVEVGEHSCLRQE